MPSYDLSPEYIAARRKEALMWQKKTDSPQNGLRLVAVTGTNGKTSVSSLLAQLLRASGEKTGLIGTIACSDGERETPASYTTPPPAILYPMLAEMAKNGVRTVVLEASSHALSQERLFGLTFALAVFTNLTRDHLDYHGSRDAYLAAKAKLFAASQNALINADDAAAKEMAFHTAGNVYYCSAKEKNAEFFIEAPLCRSAGITLTLDAMGEAISAQTPLIGDFNVTNVAEALAAAYLLGVPKARLIRAASSLKAPSGRLERLENTGDITIFIDYAHTPDALEKALTALRPHSKKLTVLFGAGGDRDVGKRAEMGKIAETLADLVIVTDDNPRSEDPEHIRRDILSGMKKENHVVLPDRRRAIEFAVQNAAAGETILLAGKGHEEYIIDRIGKHDFSERQIVWDTIRRGK